MEIGRWESRVGWRRRCPRPAVPSPCPARAQPARAPSEAAFQGHRRWVSFVATLPLFLSFLPLGHSGRLAPSGVVSVCGLRGRGGRNHFGLRSCRLTDCRLNADPVQRCARAGALSSGRSGAPAGSVWRLGVLVAPELLICRNLPGPSLHRFPASRCLWVTRSVPSLPKGTLLPCHF